MRRKLLTFKKSNHQLVNQWLYDHLGIFIEWSHSAMISHNWWRHGHVITPVDALDKMVAWLSRRSKYDIDNCISVCGIYVITWSCVYHKI